MLALDTSRSMAGKPLVEAATAATAFVAAKPACDRVALVTFGQHASQEGAFSTSTIDADNTLRTLAVGANSGTALWDAVDLSARLLASQQGGRVVVLLTDGDDVGSRASESDAILSLHKAGAVVYPIAFGSHADSSGLERLARETGGSFHAAATSTTLSGIYRSIGLELRRTWRVRYLTTARPGDKLELKASVGSFGSDTTSVSVPGSGSATNDKPSPLLPDSFYGRAGDLLFTLLAALLVLAAGILAASTLRGSWLKRRLAAHVDPSRGRAAKHSTARDRLAMLGGLFLRLGRVDDARRQELAARSPLVVTVVPGSIEPRYVSLRARQGASRRPVEAWDLSDLDIEAEEVGLEGAWTKVASADERPARTAGTIVKDEGEGGKQLAEFLAGQKFI